MIPATTSATTPATTLTDVLADALCGAPFDLAPTLATTLAEQIICSAAQRGHGGADYYLPMSQHINRRERNEQIRREFVGTNLRAVCRKYQVSKTTVYRIVRRNENPE